mgnify:CR=1 FL=1
MAEAHSATLHESSPSGDAVDRLAGTLAGIVGDANVITDETERKFYSEDIYREGALVALAVRPGNTEELAKAVAAATSAGFAVVPRGGGMSYTSGYTQDQPGAVIFDLRRMNAIKEINQEDMYVTVECGCTWAQLHEALQPKGLRTPFWGTLSGIHATVGGGLSQNGLFFGSAQYGPATESLIAMKVVLADGTVVPTATLATKGVVPFNLHYCPDLNGLFVGDTGALGFKAEATFRLIRDFAHEDSISFAFDGFEACTDVLCEWGRAGIACEVFGFDPKLAEVRLQRESLAKDLASLKGVVTGRGNILEGVKDAAKVALAGRRYMDEVVYSAHAVVEGHSAAAVEAGIAALRKIAEGKGGRPIANSIPKIIRANPFTPLNNVLGPDGRRWIPIHGLFPHSKAKTVWQAVYDLFDRYKDQMESHNITYGFLVTSMSTNAFLIEPVMFWPERHFSIHARTVQENVLSRLPKMDDNPAASALVDEIKKALARLFLEHGGSHFQIGRAYLYKDGRVPETWRLVEGIKDLVDPERRVNPGSLGLE